MQGFCRVSPVPRYAVGVVLDLFVDVGRHSEDISDRAVEKPGLATLPHIVPKLVDAARNRRNHDHPGNEGTVGLRVAAADRCNGRYDADRDPVTLTGE